MEMDLIKTPELHWSQKVRINSVVYITTNVSSGLTVTLQGLETISFIWQQYVYRVFSWVNPRTFNRFFLMSTYSTNKETDRFGSPCSISHVLRSLMHYCDKNESSFLTNRYMLLKHQAEKKHLEKRYIQ